MTVTADFHASSSWPTAIHGDAHSESRSVSSTTAA